MGKVVVTEENGTQPYENRTKRYENSWFETDAAGTLVIHKRYYSDFGVEDKMVAAYPKGKWLHVRLSEE